MKYSCVQTYKVMFVFPDLTITMFLFCELPDAVVVAYI